MNIIYGNCVTNLDEFKREEWPTAFVAVPSAGECVMAASGRTLKVVRVTHREIHRDRPMIEVELNR